jgi:hypothetical protein
MTRVSRSALRWNVEDLQKVRKHVHSKCDAVLQFHFYFYEQHLCTFVSCRVCNMQVSVENAMCIKQSLAYTAHY